MNILVRFVAFVFAFTCIFMTVLVFVLLIVNGNSAITIEFNRWGEQLFEMAFTIIGTLCLLPYLYLFYKGAEVRA